MMLKSIFTLSAACAVISTAYAVEITVSSNPALPAVNMVKNASFDDEKLSPWRANTKLSAVDKEEKFSGSSSIKLTGDPAQIPNVSQSLNIDNVKAGDLMYMRFAAKNVDPDLEKKPASVAWQFTFANGKRQYMSTVSLPREDYDWAVFEHVVPMPADPKNVTFYLCYYRQAGKQFFDDVVIQGGSTELNISVKGKNLKSIKVRHSVTGTVLSDKITGNSYNKTIKVPYFGSYAVEVTDKQGRRTCKLYPENVDANRTGENLMPLTPVKRISIASNAPESLTFDLPDDTANKKYFLEFSGRSNQTGPVAGYTAMLRVSVNGKVCRANELVKPQNRSATASGGEMIFTRNLGYVLYYSNACYGISEESNYCPVSLPDRNPFNFRLDITKLVKGGQNTLKLENVLPARVKKTLYIDNLTLVTE